MRDPDPPTDPSLGSLPGLSATEALAWIREGEIGRRAEIDGPFGPRLVSYADLTATGRYLRFVEAWISSVLPYYANTHTEVSTTGRALSRLREQARRIIREDVGAGPDHVVVFCGAGATQAANTLVGVLGLRIDEPLERSYRLSRAIPEGERPVVFVGPYEHHSNLLPWVESIAEVVEIPIDSRGAIDLEALRETAERYRERPLRIGAFSAASNVTGLLSDVRALARTLHEAGAFAVFDYAAAGPYVPIDMTPEDPREHIDALFLSTHKFPGGPGGSGVLVARRELFRARTPARPGGGTVDYVAGPSREAIDYVADLAEREEGGTPAILGDLRAGAAFLVKRMVGAETIQRHELALAERALRRLSKHPRIRVLGPHDLPRLATLSIDVRGLHHDFVSALLDHLFGIQNRAGCACAGPYGHRLLGIDPAESDRFRALVRRGLLGMKPGWVRVSLPYYASEEDVEFVLSAIEFVAEHGEALLPQYRFSFADGVWRHAERDRSDRLPLTLEVEALYEAALSLGAGDPERRLYEADIREERVRYFEEARAIVREAKRELAERPPSWNPPTGDPEVDALVWFRYVLADPLPPAPESASS